MRWGKGFGMNHGSITFSLECRGSMLPALLIFCKIPSSEWSDWLLL